jgi:uncharacterized protein YkwD/PKD repeat protein
MKLKPRLLVAVMVVAAIIASFFVQRDQAASTLAASYTGVAQIAGPLQLDLSVSPPIGTPRDTLRLTAVLTNHQSLFASPTITLKLPSVLRAELSDLPAGATMNLATNSLQWLPVVPPNGERRELVLDLKVSSADLTHPEQTLTAAMHTTEEALDTSVVLWIGIPPKVKGFEGPLRVSVGQPLPLVAEIEGPGPFTEQWDLGDGRRVPVNQPTIVYPTAGVYDVTLMVKNPIGTATRTEQVTVIPHAVAEFVPDDDKVGLAQIVTFENLSGGQGPIRYTWDFGDGASATDPRPQHSYAAAGTYQVKLIVENEFGRSETTQSIAVGAPPTADIYVAELSAAGEPLTGEVIGGPAQTEYVWSMGDGRRYDGAKVSHSFRQKGDYYVTLTASNEFGSTEVGRWVHVQEGTPKVFLPVISHLAGISSGSSVDLTVAEGLPALEEVALDAPFMMEPLPFAAGTSSTAQLLGYINQARGAFDLGPLTAVSELSAAAQKHAADMAAARHNQHVGSDGSTPRDRFLQFSYPHAYAGEATAWGFADPRQSVEFWVNSPSHRPIILNRYATEVGLGHVTDYAAPSVWYWTAEFGNGSGVPDPSVMRVQSPEDGREALNSEMLTFSWNWPRPLAASEQFTLYFSGANGRTAVTTLNQATLGTKYAVTLLPLDRPDLLGAYQWQIVLENNRGAEIMSSEKRGLIISVDPSLPTATPLPTATAIITATPQATPAVTPTTVPPTPTPRPPQPTLPPLVIATPLPSEP